MAEPDTPKPVRLDVSGLLPALSVTLNVAARVPVAAGLNVTVIVQLVPAARLGPQSLLCAKSPGLVPPIVMLPMVSDALLLAFNKVTV